MLKSTDSSTTKPIMPLVKRFNQLCFIPDDSIVGSNVPSFGPLHLSIEMKSPWIQRCKNSCQSMMMRIHSHIMYLQQTIQILIRHIMIQTTIQILRSMIPMTIPSTRPMTNQSMMTNMIQQKSTLTRMNSLETVDRVCSNILVNKPLKMASVNPSNPR